MEKKCRSPAQEPAPKEKFVENKNAPVKLKRGFSRKWRYNSAELKKRGAGKGKGCKGFSRMALLHRKGRNNETRRSVGWGGWGKKSMLA